MEIALHTDGLTPLTSALGAEWEFWETKSPNLHRGLVVYRPKERLSAEEIEARLRSVVTQVFRPSWWRGFGFGVVVEYANDCEPSLSTLPNCVDSYNRNAGVLQWLIAIDHTAERYFATHMWMHGYLHPYFEKTLDSLAPLKYVGEKSYKARPGFFAFIERQLSFCVKAIVTLRYAKVAIPLVFAAYIVRRYVRGL